MHRTLAGWVRVAQDDETEVATEGPSFFLCGCDPDTISYEHGSPERANERGRGLGRLATSVLNTVGEAVRYVSFVAKELTRRAHRIS